MRDFQRKEALPRLTEKMLEVQFGDLSKWLSNFPWLANSVMSLSDHFGKDRRDDSLSTPWKKQGVLEAYLAYFHALNSARMSRILKESFAGQSFSPSTIVDYGSGLGASLCAFSEWLSVTDRDWWFLEPSVEARQRHKNLVDKMNLGLKAHWVSEPEDLPKTIDLWMSSYSLNEIQSLPESALRARNIVIMDASQSQVARDLMGLRETLLANGFQILAPCCHSLKCPLLLHTKTDFCHDRIGFQAPKWFEKLEEKLPITNRSLTYSYLVASRDLTPKTDGWTRLIGDTLQEKGKTRQAICRSSDREFLSWLKRDGKAPSLPHGGLVQIPEEATRHGNEVRVGRAILRLPDDPGVDFSPSK